VELYGGELWHHQLQTWIQHHQERRKGKKICRWVHEIMSLHLACFTRFDHNNFFKTKLGLKHYSQNCLVALAMRSTRFLEMKWGIIKHDLFIFIGNFKLSKHCKNLEQTLKTQYKKLCNLINQSIYLNNILPFCIVGYCYVKFFDGVKCEQHTY